MDRPVLRPDQVTLGVLILQVSREEVDAAIAGFVIAAYALREGREAWEGELVGDDD